MLTLGLITKEATVEAGNHEIQCAMFAMLKAKTQ
jgi:hypothetical protein